jgi:hypothetical protein
MTACRSLLAVVVAMACATVAVAGRGAKITCPPGRYLVQEGAPLLPAGRPLQIDAVAVHANGAISIDSGCPPVQGKVKATKHGPHLKVRWRAGACTGVASKAKVHARVTADCNMLSGTLKAKGLRVSFGATRSACGDGIIDVEGGEICDGVLLTGDPGDPALPALFTLPPKPALPADVVSGLLLTRLDVVLTADATVGQVNAALGAVNGNIVSMKAGLPAVTVAVPRQDGAAGLRTLADQLAAKPGILLAQVAREANGNVAPPAPANDATAFAYLQDARFPAAWNAKRLLDNCADKVSVLVVDRFHNPVDALYADFATQIPGATFIGTGGVPSTDTDGFHGYDVTTTLAANFDATVPTGANPFPQCLDVRTLQTFGLSPLETMLAIDTAIPGSGKVVVNESLGFDSCDGPCDATTLNVPRAAERAAWGVVQRALLQPVENRLLATSSAGNEADTQVGLLYPGAAVAAFGSALNIAAKADSTMSFVSDTNLWEPTSNCSPNPCFPSMTATPAERATLDVLLADLDQSSAPPAPNVMVIGSSDDTLNNPSAFSDPGSDVNAVGENIPTLLGVQTQGTSFASPQVAGLVTYLWLLSPALRARPVADTIAAIEANKRLFPVNLIDAYATVLSLDPAASPDPVDSKVRLAILDADGDGDFDQADLQQFHDAFRPGGIAIEPSTRDDSRFDLNGDGFTGGTRTTRFDLDPTGSTRFGAPMLTQVSEEVSGQLQTFNETAVTDADVLCYYAYSPLFSAAADPVERDALLFDLCGGQLSFSGGIVVRTDVDASRNCNPDCTTEQGFEQESWTVRLDAQTDGTFEATGTVTQSLHDVTTHIGSQGQPCLFTWDESGAGPVLSYGGHVADPAGVLEGVATVTRTFTTGACDGNPESVDMEVTDRNFSVGSDVVTPQFDNGALTGFTWSFHFDDGAGTVDSVDGSASLIP